MPKNEAAMKWETTVIKNKREGGHSWNAIKAAFRNMHNYEGVAIAMRLEREERTTWRRAMAL